MKKLALLVLFFISFGALALSACSSKPEATLEPTAPVATATVSPEETVVPTETPVETPVPEEGWSVKGFYEKPETTYWLFGPGGFEKELDFYPFLEETHRKDTVVVFDADTRSLYIAKSNDTTRCFVKVSGECLIINYQVAQDHLYWFTPDREVWWTTWNTGTAEGVPVPGNIFCENAIAISPFHTENQGAIVDADRANVPWEKKFNILSPYYMERGE